MYAATASVYLFALNILFIRPCLLAIATRRLDDAFVQRPGRRLSYLTAPCGSPLPNMAVNANWGTHGSERPKPSISATERARHDARRIDALTSERGASTFRSTIGMDTRSAPPRSSPRTSIFRPLSRADVLAGQRGSPGSLDANSAMAPSTLSKMSLGGSGACRQRLAMSASFGSGAASKHAKRGVEIASFM